MRAPSKLTIESLLESNEQFVVPHYQRGYDWKGTDQVSDLFMDFKDCIGSKTNRNLFLGTMIFDVSKEDSDILSVIDGQQRLTTLIITLIACRQYIKANIEDELLAPKADNLIKGADKLIRTKDSLGEEVKLQLCASNTISDIFEIMCDDDWDGTFPVVRKVSKKKVKQIKLQVRRVKPVYTEAYKQIEKFCGNEPVKIRELLEQIYRRTYIIRIDITRVEEAFEIFERTNARGKDLEVADLLKNFLFSKEGDFAAVQKTWSKIESNSRGSILRMLKYFWNTRQGHISTRDLYREITKYAKAHGESIEGFLNEMELFSDFYAAYYSDKKDDFKDWLIERNYSKKDSYLGEASRSIGALRAFRIHQATPLVFSAIQCHLRTKEAPKTLLSFLRYIEGYHFINSSVCGRPGNEVEKVYTEYCLKFHQSDNFSKVFGALTERLGQQLSPKELFVSEFCNLNYKDNYMVVRYVFDRLQNDGVKGPQTKIFDYYDSRKKVSSYTVEHILPQAHLKTLEEGESGEYINMIGNLMILSEQENGSLGSKSFVEKMSILKQPHKHKSKIKTISVHVQKFLEDYGDLKEWNESVIDKRSETLAKKVYQMTKERYAY